LRKSALLLALLACLCVASAASADNTKMMMMPSASEMKWMSMTGPAHPAGIPSGAIGIGGCIPTMGYHYANPKDFPFGPIYGWYNGQVTFTEIMVDQKAFASGKSWNNELTPLPGHHIDHVDIWFEAHGHPGYTIPHYDIHAWYIPASQYMYFCGNTSGKKPAWFGP
jgi:hypothetical protein